MLSKLLAALVVSVAVAFAGYTMVHDSTGSHCCSGSVVTPAAVSTESSCCQEAMPSCCEATSAATAVCPGVCPADKAAAASVPDEKVTKVEDK